LSKQIQRETPQNDILGNLIFAHLITTFPGFNVTLGFNTVFTRAQ